MSQSEASIAQQIARAACEFEQRAHGRLPTSVTVVLSDNTLVVTLHGALSPAEKALARSPAGANQVQELHRQIFDDSGSELRQQIKRITGVEISEAATEVAPDTGAVVKVFSSGTIVQVFLLDGRLQPDSWSGSGLSGQT